MTTSQTASTHGVMVPTKVEYAHVTKRGLITAVVMWEKKGDSLRAQGYAPDEQSFNRAAMLDYPHLGEQIDGLREARKLVDFYWDLVPLTRKIFRVDDHRPGNNRSYLVQLGRPAKRTRLARGVVYHYFDDEEKMGPNPRLRQYGEVLSLMRDPSALVITDAEGFEGRDFDDEGIRDRFDFDNRVLVWDLSEMQRNTARRYAARTGK